MLHSSRVVLQGRCESPAPAAFNLTQPLPRGTCAVLVREDFLEVPLGAASPGSGGLLLDSLYVAMASPNRIDSAVLLLQVRMHACERQGVPAVCTHDNFTISSDHEQDNARINIEAGRRTAVKPPACACIGRPAGASTVKRNSVFEYLRATSFRT